MFSLLFLIRVAVCSAQFNVTEIITDYGGYWKSAAAAVNTVKPDNSHNLLSFSFNGNRYSTGVNDALLVSKGQIFIPEDYRALPVNNVTSAVTSNTKVGLGYMYDGNANGASSPAPINNIPKYLTDGIKGLDLGTCIANLPAGTMNFAVGGIIPTSINDGIPDVVITQIADPSGSSDRYEFTDINGAVVGNYVDIVLTNIPPVGNWTADFYEASQNPMTLASGFTKTDRPIRLWATDVSAFGINSTNATKVAYFKIILSGNSDVAFVSYNANSINLISALLPINISSFSGKQTNSQVQLNWQSSSEMNSDAFIVEKSTDGTAFETIGNIKAAGNSVTAASYSFTDKNPAGGKNYYRLKMADKDGAFEYSAVIVVNSSYTANTSISFFPNPARSSITINHPYAGNNEQFQIINMQGAPVLQKKITASSFQTQIDLTGLANGSYQLLWTDGKNISANKLMIL